MLILLFVMFASPTRGRDSSRHVPTSAFFSNCRFLESRGSTTSMSLSFHFFPPRLSPDEIPTFSEQMCKPTLVTLVVLSALSFSIVQCQ